MTPKLEQINVKHIFGIFLIALSLFSAIGAFGWMVGYLDNQFQETYRDHDIYYFPNPNVYGIDIGGEPSGWPFNAGLQGCRNMIDSWLDDPEYIETYRDFEIYQIKGFNLYYGVNGEQITAKWRLLEALEEYIDAEYYPTSGNTIPGDQDPLSGASSGGLTLGDRLDAQREMISAISGLFGLGFIALGEAERQSDE